MRVIGMISGTSFDAIEAVALEMAIGGDAVVAQMLGHVSSPYPEEVRAAVAAVLPPAATSIEAICKLDTAIGHCFAEVAGSLADRYFDGLADVVCSHGQTVFHWVEGGHALGTLQLGQPSWIAERTGATVVSDVRSRDIAAGGHGAPLASLLDVMLLGTRPSVVRGALNLGGISNITVVGPTHAPLAFDIGPANALMDAAVVWLTDGKADHDHNGELAAKGTVDRMLLDELLAEPYYRAEPPKSTGKELFHRDYLFEHLAGRDVAPADLLATLTALTAETVARSVRDLGVRELFASGGGTRNPVLMASIAERLPEVTMSPFGVLGIDEAAKEAVVFATIGLLSVEGLTGSVPSCTGARHASVLGSITPGRQPIRATDDTAPPSRFTVLPAGGVESGARAGGVE